ncbi:MAG: DUF2490 domain-containing protein [Bacteroidales bacterium]|nr:DUF2490 domain-containing protein [Bacteroidales bacterium]
MRRLLLITILVLSSFQVLSAQEKEEDNTFGGWEFIEATYNFKKAPLFATVYFEHDNYQYQRLECWYLRTMVGWKITDWLKADVAYDFMQEPGFITHRAVFDLQGTLKQGNLKVSVRERYIHTWSPEIHEQSNVLRSRLKVQYSIPNTKFSPYLAAEVFTWGTQWKKTRHYVACTYDFTDFMQLEWYYLYYAFNGKPAEHVLGIGLNFDF